MIFADTGFFVALFEKSDGLHERASRWAAACTDNVLLTEFVLLETFNQFSKPVQRTKVRLVQRSIAANPQFEVLPLSSELYAAGLTLHQARPDKAWSVTDCISFVVMERLGISQALAHDHHFEQAGFEPLLRRDP